jgi:anti-anti-sigma factor
MPDFNGDVEFPSTDRMALARLRPLHRYANTARIAGRGRLTVEIGEARQDGMLVLRPVGRIDNLTSAAFQDRLLVAARAGAADVVVDFTAVEYISSAGLRALMAASKLKPKERRIGVAALNSIVAEIFAISRFSEVIPVFESVAAAVAAGASAAHQLAEAAPMRVHFWGSRGSLPAPLGAAAVRGKVRDALLAARKRELATVEAIDAFIDRELPFTLRGTFGGNTACVEIVAGGDEYVLCDLGTGVREFGRNLVAEYGPDRKHCFNVFLSHLHWDHVMGFPFFPPAYIQGNLIRIHGCHRSLRDALRRQHQEPGFPVDFDTLGATIEFVELVPGRTHQVAGLSVLPIQQFHGGDSYGYRFSRGDKSIVYSTDCEHKYSVLDESYPFVHFYRNADLLIFDAMYSLADTVSVKEDWGHSSNIVAVELAQAAQVKRLVLFHHEPAYDDRMIEAVYGETLRFEEISRDGHKVEVIAAFDGLDLTV